SWLWLRLTPTSVRAANRTGSGAGTGPLHTDNGLPLSLVHARPGCEVMWRGPVGRVESSRPDGVSWRASGRKPDVVGRRHVGLTARRSPHPRRRPPLSGLQALRRLG